MESNICTNKFFTRRVGVFDIWICLSDLLICRTA